MSVTHNNANVYFYRKPISALVMSHHQALSKKKTLKLQFRMDRLHYRGSRLRHCSTSRTVAGSIPEGVNGIFHWHNLSSLTMALGLTEPLTEMSTRNIYWDKGGWYVGLTNSPPSCANYLEIWEPQPSGIHWACPGLYRDCFTLTLYYKHIYINIYIYIYIYIYITLHYIN
jgi:hypothetical protein